MIRKDFASITASDIHDLLANGVQEGRTIEYKSALPGSTDQDKKEFLADVSAFANTDGGDLIFGIDEAGGIPTSILGLNISDVDLEIQRLDSIISSGIAPRIPYAIRAVDVSSIKVLLIRIERSLNAPHRVIYKGSDKFYGRASAAKYPLDVDQLRDAFTLGLKASDKLRAFRTDRIIEIVANRTPIECIEGSKIIVHLFPLDAFRGNKTYDLQRIQNRSLPLTPIFCEFGDTRITFDGVLAYRAGKQGCLSYTHLYRNGIIEGVNTTLLNQSNRVIPSLSCEQGIIDFYHHKMSLLMTLGVQLPIGVGITLTNIRGAVMGTHEMDFRDKIAITNEHLILPEIVVNDYSQPAASTLRPLFDLVWNACGLEGSENYNTRGEWAPRRH